MPLYDFECEDCGYIEEILTRSAGNAEIVLTCPECEKETYSHFQNIKKMFLGRTCHRKFY